MFKRIINRFRKKNLKNKEFEYLFDEPLKDEYVCLDCETTGLNPKKMKYFQLVLLLLKKIKF